MAEAYNPIVTWLGQKFHKTGKVRLPRPGEYFIRKTSYGSIQIPRMTERYEKQCVTPYEIVFRVS